MTTRGIQDQINAIKNATQKASLSKKGALAFLRKAGIIDAVPAGNTKVITNTSEKASPAKKGKKAGWFLNDDFNVIHLAESNPLKGSPPKLDKDLEREKAVHKNISKGGAPAVIPYKLRKKGKTTTEEQANPIPKEGRSKYKTVRKISRKK